MSTGFVLSQLSRICHNLYSMWHAKARDILYVWKAGLPLWEFLYANCITMALYIDRPWISVHFLSWAVVLPTFSLICCVLVFTFPSLIFFLSFTRWRMKVWTFSVTSFFWILWCKIALTRWNGQTRYLALCVIKNLFRFWMTDAKKRKQVAISWKLFFGTRVIRCNFVLDHLLNLLWCQTVFLLGVFHCIVSLFLNNSQPVFHISRFWASANSQWTVACSFRLSSCFPSWQWQHQKQHPSVTWHQEEQFLQALANFKRLPKRQSFLISWLGMGIWGMMILILRVCLNCWMESLSKHSLMLQTSTQTWTANPGLLQIFRSLDWLLYLGPGWCKLVQIAQSRLYSKLKALSFWSWSFHWFVPYQSLDIAGNHTYSCVTLVENM